MIKSSTQKSSAEIPICIDLDGTIIHSDLLVETFILLLKTNPLYLLYIPFWLIKGKAFMKSEIAKKTNLNPVALPYNIEFINWLNSQRLAGRNLWLCTASNYRLANTVASHLQIFQGVIASDDRYNLSGTNKANLLVEKFGEKCFDYCGNDNADLAVWNVCHKAIIVNGSKKLHVKTAKASEIIASFPKKTNQFRSILKALRLHQWTKNLLIFVPLITAHKLTDPILFVNAAIAFIAFGLCASSVYLLNDMLDLESDRLHPRKSKRPFASGDLPIIYGFALIPTLLTCSLVPILILGVPFMIVLGSYYLLTVAYSFGLKSIVLIDVITLAGLYTLRIIAGAIAINVPLSFWLLLFSIFIFLSLALVKRYAELDNLRLAGKINVVGRGYNTNDMPTLFSLGTTSGYLSVLVLALYINSTEINSQYHHPQIIWLLCIIFLYWISRVWMITHKGDMHDDPVMFAIKDRVSIATGLLCALILSLAV